MGDNQKRYTISFRENEQEQELWQWIEKKRGIIPVAVIIKELLYKAMIEEKEGN